MTTQALASYSPLDVVAIITQESTGVSHRVVGFAEDSFINVERDSGTWTHGTGVDNFATRTYMANTSGKLTLSLMQGSPSNDVLTAFYLRDAATRNNSGIFSIIVKDGSGRSVYSSSQAYIGTVPNSPFGKDAGNREWVINCTAVDTFIGGNGLINPEDVDTLASLDVNVDPAWVR